MTNETYSIDIIPPKETDIVTRLPFELVAKLETISKLRGDTINSVMINIIDGFVSAEVDDLTTRIVESIPGLYDKGRMERTDKLLKLVESCITHLEISSELSSNWVGDAPITNTLIEHNKMFINLLKLELEGLLNVRYCTIGLNVTDNDITNLENMFKLYKEYINHIKAIDYRTNGAVIRVPDSTLFISMLSKTFIDGLRLIVGATAQLNDGLMCELDDYITNEVEDEYVELLGNLAKSRGITVPVLIINEYENLLSRNDYTFTVIATNAAGVGPTDITMHSDGLTPEGDLAASYLRYNSENPVAVEETSDNYKIKLSRLESTLHHLTNTRKYLIDIRDHRISEGNIFSLYDSLIDAISSYIDAYDNFVRVKSIEEAIEVIDFEKLELFDKHLQEVYHEDFIETEIVLGDSFTDRPAYNKPLPMDPDRLINALNSTAPGCFL